jgi:hypothetical protein
MILNHVMCAPNFFHDDDDDDNFASLSGLTQFKVPQANR